MNDPIKKVVDDMMENDPCEHGFIIFVSGEHQFQCQDCGRFFSSLPTDPKKLTWKEVSAILSGFTFGMSTLTEAVKESQLSLDAFKRSLSEALPKDFEMEQIQTLGSPTPSYVITSAKNRRTSDPETVDEFFSDLDSATLSDLKAVIAERFPDVNGYEFYNSTEDDSLVVIVSYIDGTTQRVVVPQSRFLR